MYSVTTRLTASASLLATLSACGMLYKLDVTAYNTPRPDLGKKYVVVSSNPELDVNSAEFKTYAIQLERAMSDRGYKRLPNDRLSEANLAVYIAATVGEPGKRYHTVRNPVYEAVYPESAGADRGNTAGNRSDGGQSGQSHRRPPIKTPTPEALVGYKQSSFATTVYTKNLNIVAVDLQQYLKDIQTAGSSEITPKEVWSVEVETTGSPHDLSEVIPVMIAAAKPYIGTSTDDKVSVRLDERSAQVVAISTD